MKPFKTKSKTRCIDISRCIITFFGVQAIFLAGCAEPSRISRVTPRPPSVSERVADAAPRLTNTQPAQSEINHGLSSTRAIVRLSRNEIETKSWVENGNKIEYLKSEIVRAQGRKKAIEVVYYGNKATGGVICIDVVSGLAPQYFKVSQQRLMLHHVPGGYVKKVYLSKQGDQDVLNIVSDDLLDSFTARELHSFKYFNDESFADIASVIETKAHP